MMHDRYDGFRWRSELPPLREIRALKFVSHTEEDIRSNAQAEANRSGKPQVVVQNPQTWHYMSGERWESQREHLEACGNVAMYTVHPEPNP